MAEKEKRIEGLEETVKQSQEDYLKSREADVERARGEVEVAGGYQKKMDDAVAGKEDELRRVREEARKLEVDVERKAGEIGRLEEAVKALEQLTGELKRENAEKTEGVQKFEKTVAKTQTADEKLRGIVSRKQRAIASVQRVIDRELVPLKHDLRNLKVQVGTDLESFGKDVYEIVKTVHEKWGEENKWVPGSERASERACVRACVQRERSEVVNPPPPFPPPPGCARGG
jgi:chromosome segregation ATPase